jgi:transcriptional regulator with XRE-family HTH domain
MSGIRFADPRKRRIDAHGFTNMKYGVYHMIAREEIGARIKAKRLKLGMTLKDLSQATDLSVGFLSQFERGMSSIAIDSLEKVANVLSLPLFSFFSSIDEINSPDQVIRYYEMRPDHVNPRIFQYVLSHNVHGYCLLPRIFMLMPMNENRKIELYSHNGDEFLYVLEGVVTLYVDNDTYVLYPGDSTLIHSRQPHNWINLTNNVVRILTVNCPNPFVNAQHNADTKIDQPQTET